MMNLIGHKRVIRHLLLLLVLSIGGIWGIQAQNPVELSPAATFITYRCVFQPETNSARIRAVLLGSDGLPIPSDAYAVTVSIAETGEALSPDKVSSAAATARPPVQMILVLDITDTAPVQEIVTAISEQLMPQLEVLDEVALITFSEEISPRTQFYTDKNRLLNEHVLDLTTLPGENRLYDAILNAVLDLPLGSDMRQVVLVITDSGRRELEQAATETIIAEAQGADIQVYSIGYHYQDKPDTGELTAIANGTGGYAWIYDEADRTRASLETALREYLGDFVHALNSEIIVSVDLHGLASEERPRINFNVAVDAANENPLSDQISCPVEILNHAISFVDDLEGQVVTEQTDIVVSVQSDMNLAETTVVFWVNNEIAQNSHEHTYVLNAPELAPGYYTVGAQLRDRYNQPLATTPTEVRFYVQHELELRMFDAVETVTSGNTRFEVIGNPRVALPGVNLVVTSSTDSQQSHILSANVPFEEDGTAIWVVNDLPAALRTLFPEITESGGYVVLRAAIPGPLPTDLPLAVSNNINFSLPTPPVAAPPKYELRDFLPAAIIVFLVTLNVLLFRFVKYLRIRRIIRFPDDYELSSQLMSITIRRESGRQTHTLTKKTVYVGRGSANDINLGDDANISRQHGIVMWRNENWYYSNRKRRLKTRINAKWYKGYVFYKLEPVTEMEIGSVYLVFHSNAQRDIADFITTNL